MSISLPCLDSNLCPFQMARMPSIFSEISLCKNIIHKSSLCNTYQPVKSTLSFQFSANESGIFLHSSESTHWLITFLLTFLHLFWNFLRNWCCKRHWNNIRSLYVSFFENE